jgi:hypothetical protein
VDVVVALALERTLSVEMVKSSPASPAKVGNLMRQGLLSSNIWMWRGVWFRVVVALFWATEVSIYMMPVFVLVLFNKNPSLEYC